MAVAPSAFGALNTIYFPVSDRGREIGHHALSWVSTLNVLRAFLFERCSFTRRRILGCIVVLPLNGLTPAP